jgi:uncharacterized membrane protein
MVNTIIRNASIRQYFSNRTGLYQTLVLHTLFCLALVGFRVIYTGESMFLFLVWNLFLAYLPYILSTYIARRVANWSKGRLIIALAPWLLLVPNSFYILTDLFHLRPQESIPLWYDLALIIAFAWNGLIVGVLSIRQIEVVIQRRWQSANEWLFILPVMYLNALGIFIGRYLRFNSWDVITNPLGLVNEVLYLLIHPIRNRFDWSMIICFTLLLALFYLTLKKMTPGAINKEGTL